MLRYTRKDFDRDFPDDATCLDWLARYLWPTFPNIACASQTCQGKVRKHHRVVSRASFSCDECGNHVHPKKGTIYQHSSTPMRTWFLAIFLVAQTRTGFPAKWLQRECGVTYKTAWRMLHEIRKMLDEGPPTLSGKVEVDETYFGGRKRGNRGLTNDEKSKIVGLVQRGGRAYAEIVPNVRAATLVPVIRRYVALGSTVYTDELKSYKLLPRYGYPHESVSHTNKEWARGLAHVNTVEGFWSNFKRGVDGAHRHISRKYLQRYIDEYAFRFNHRNDELPMFWSALTQVSA